MGGGDVYRAGLISYDPKTKETKDHGRMDDKEQYLSNLACDDAGWVYCGIGTARHNTVAYSPGTGEKRQIVPDESRGIRTGLVQRGTDGKAYARRSTMARWWRPRPGVTSLRGRRDLPGRPGDHLV